MQIAMAVHKKILEQRDAEIAPLQVSLLETEAFADDVEAQKPQPVDKSAFKKLTDTIRYLETLIALFSMQLEGLGEAAADQLESYRLFKYLRGGITRKGKTPNSLNSFAKIGAVGGLEAGLSGWTYSLGGKMNFIAGLGYGALFAFLNLSIAIALGYFCGRFGTIRYHDHFDIVKLRFLAWLLGCVLLALLVALILSAARMRSMPIGRELYFNEGLWNFEELSMAATFSDGYTIVLFGIAAMASLYGFYEGYCQLSDPIPGFTDEQRNVDALLLKGEDACELSVQTVEQISADAADDFFAQFPTPEEIAQYNKVAADAVARAREHNLSVRNTENSLRDLDSTVLDIHSSRSIDTDMSYLLIDVVAVKARLVLPKFTDTSTEDLLGKLEGQTQLTIAAIREAHVAYQNNLLSVNTDGAEPIEEI